MSDYSDDDGSAYNYDSDDNVIDEVGLQRHRNRTLIFMALKA